MITKYEFASIWFNLILFNLVGPVHNNLKFFFLQNNKLVCNCTQISYEFYFYQFDLVIYTDLTNI